MVAPACREGANGPVKPGAKEQSFDTALGDSFIPSPQSEKLKRDRARALELAGTLKRLDGVDEARVHLSLADKSILSRNREHKSKAAILIKRASEGVPDERTVRDFAAAAVPDLEPSEVRVFFSGPSTPPTKTVLIGPIEVSARTVKKAKLILGGLLILCMVLAVGLVAAGLKLKKLRNRSGQHSP